MTDREMLALRRVLALGLAVVAHLAALPPLNVPRRRARYAVEDCAGYRYDSMSFDALGQSRCADCGWSWGSHGTYGRPRPEQAPPDADDETVARAFADDES